MLLRIFLFNVIIMLCASSAHSNKIAVAVNDLKGEGLDESSTRIISERIRSELVNTGIFRVMERGEMENILKEQGFQQSGICTDQACLVEVGQLLGVDRMIAGTIGILGNLFTISLRMISVETGEILFVANEDCKCSIEDLISGPVPAIVRKIADKTTGKEDAASPQNPATGLLEVTSNPSGARFSLDGKVVGTTPYVNPKLKVGEYDLKLDLSGYETKAETISLSPGSPLKLNYNLNKNRRPGGSKKSQLIRKIAFGAIAGLSAAAGVKLNFDVESKYKFYSDYNGIKQGVHDENWDQVRRMVVYRNGAYIISGISAACFGFSFFF